MSVVRAKKYELKAGDVRQIKMIDIEAPLRFLVVGVGASFEYSVYVEESEAIAAAGITSGPVAPPGGAWGSEIRIECLADGVLYVAYVG